MTVQSFFKSPEEKQKIVISDIQALYHTFYKQHSATLSFRKVKTMTKHSHRLVQYCLSVDECFKKEMKEQFLNKTKTMTRNFSTVYLSNTGRSE